MKDALIALVMLAAAGTAASETIYRCGSEYTNTSVPCPDARAVAVASATVSAGQLAEARRVAQREKALAAEMVSDRRAREAALKPALAGSLSGPRVAAVPEPGRKHTKKRKQNAVVDPDRGFVASVPKTRTSAR